jgi:hypothetical protein
LHERIDYLQDRVNFANQDGWLSPREYRRLMDRLVDLRREEQDIRRQNGGRLAPPDRDYLARKLNDLSRRLERDQQDF